MVRFWRDRSQKGQSLTEYAIVLSLVAVAAIAATALFGGVVKAKIASLAGIIAGQDKTKIEQSEAKAKRAAEQADLAAGQVSGMSVNHGGSSVEDGSDVIDRVSLK